MRIIVLGAGEIGRHIAISLSRAAHNIVVIESSSAIAQELEEQIDARVINGNGTSVEILVDAGVGECDLFIALTSSNENNIMASSIAKNLGALKVIARVHPGLQREEWLFDYRGHFGIDHIFSSERLSAIELAKFIRNPDSLVVEEIARGRVELQQVRVSDTSLMTNTPLKDLKIPERTRVAAITRGGDHIVPSADDKIEYGDLITIFGEPRNLRKLADKLQGKSARTKDLRVVIFGGGEYGFALAQMLESWDCKVRVFEKDEQRALELTDMLSDTTVLNADGTYLAELEEEEVGEADFFVATSGSDEDNVMTCLQVNNLGANNCLTLIHRTDYAKAISASGRHFGVLAAISPREATLRDIERFITSDRFHVVKTLGAGNVVETVVGKGAIASGRMVHEVEWPSGCVLVAKMNGVHVSVPAPDDCIEAGDTLYAMVTKKALKPFLKLVK